MPFGQFICLKFTTPEAYNWEDAINSLTDKERAAAGTKWHSYQLDTPDIGYCKVTLSDTAYIYDGTAKEPAVSVTYSTKALTEGTDYTLTYADNINAGTAKVLLTGAGSYTGETSAEFQITRTEAALSFENDTVTREVGDAAFTNTLTATTDGTITYSSSQ